MLVSRYPQSTARRRTISLTVKPRQRRRLARWAQEAYRIGARRSARLVRVAWATLLYKSRKKPQEPLIRRPREMAATHVPYSYHRLTVLLRREGWRISAKRVYRIYDEEIEGSQHRAEENRAAAASAAGPGTRAESLLVGGFRKRRVCRSSYHPHPDRDRSVHTRMCVAGSGSLHERSQSGRGPELAISERDAMPRGIALDYGPEMIGGR